MMLLLVLVLLLELLTDADTIADDDYDTSADADDCDAAGDDDNTVADGNDCNPAAVATDHAYGTGVDCDVGVLLVVTTMMMVRNDLLWSNLS